MVVNGFDQKKVLQGTATHYTLWKRGRGAVTRRSVQCNGNVASVDALMRKGGRQWQKGPKKKRYGHVAPTVWHDFRVFPPKRGPRYTAASRREPTRVNVGFYTATTRHGRDRRRRSPRKRILTDPFEFRMLQFAVRDYPTLGGERQQDEKRSQHRQAHGRQTVPGLGHMAITGTSMANRRARAVEMDGVPRRQRNWECPTTTTPGHGKQQQRRRRRQRLSRSRALAVINMWFRVANVNRCVFPFSGHRGNPVSTRVAVSFSRTNYALGDFRVVVDDGNDDDLPTCGNPDEEAPPHDRNPIFMLRFFFVFFWRLIGPRPTASCAESSAREHGRTRKKK